MPIADDYSVAVDGAIRYTGTTTNYTVIAFHRWLGDLMDDAQASGNDLLDITSATAAARSTDNIITLNAPYNLDDTATQHLYDGSIVQNNGDDIYDGILCFAPAGTPLQLIQNGAPVSPNFWDTSLNPDAGAGISHRFMVKVRSGGVDIDSRRIIGQTRATGFTYSEFNINTTARGNNVLALTYATDLNNNTSEATIRGWTTIDNTTEGFKLLDVNDDSTDEPYYSEWNKAALTINQFYERHKWLHRESTIEDSNADTASDFQVGNATITGQAQSFANGVNAQFLTRVRVQLQKVGLPTGNITVALYAHSGSFGTTSVPTGAALATSAAVDAATLTTAYKEYEFDFKDDLYEMVASTNYCVAILHAVIDGSNYVEVDGLAASGTHAGNRSQEVGTWSATAADDLAFEVFASPQQYGLIGEVFRGPTHEIAISTGTGTWAGAEELTWSGGVGQLLAVDNTAGASATQLWLQLLTGAAPTDSQVITGTTSSATATASGAATTRTTSQPPVGNSTGSAIIGAYGLGIETTDLTSADKVTDLDDILRLPPNNVTFALGGLESGEDRVLIAPLGYEFAWDNEGGTPPFQLGETLTFTAPSAGTAYLSKLVDDGTTGRMQIRMLTGTIPVDGNDITGASGATADVDGVVVPSEDPRQLKLLTTLNSSGQTSIVCTDAIPTDTPSTGTVRVQLDSGIFRRVAYTSYTSATFTTASTDWTDPLDATGGAAEAGNSIFVSYIDKDAASDTEQFTSVYLADRNLFIRVRDGGGTPIKTFETTGTLGTAGGSATAIRTSDE